MWFSVAVGGMVVVGVLLWLARTTRTTPHTPPVTPPHHVERVSFRLSPFADDLWLR